MNTKIIILSFFTVVFLHFITFYNFSFQTNNKTLNKPLQKKENKQININLAQVQIEQIKQPKKIEKVMPKKPVQKKEPKKVKKKKPIKKIEKKKRKKSEEKKQKEEPKKVKKIAKKATKKTKKKVEKKIEQKPKTNYDYELIDRIKQEYLDKLRQSINKNKYYPRISRRLKEQGFTLVSFKVHKNGKIDEIKVLESSKKRRLDKAAIEAVKSTSSFKSFPKEIQDDYLDIKLKIGFIIR